MWTQEPNVAQIFPGVSFLKKNKKCWNSSGWWEIWIFEHITGKYCTSNTLLYVNRLPVNGGQHEFDEEDGALLRVDDVCGGKAFAELVEQGGNQVLQSGNGDPGVELYGVEPSVPHRLDHVVNVDQMHWKEEDTTSVSFLSSSKTC